MLGSRRSWMLLALLVIGGPATAGVVDVPRVVIAGDHIGNAFLQRPNTRVFMQTKDGLKRMIGIRSTRGSGARRDLLPSLPPSSLWCLGGALLLSARMVLRRAAARPRAA